MERQTINVYELAMQFGISLPKAYELAHSEGFPMIRVGTRILIPKDGLKAWLREQTANK